MDPPPPPPRVQSTGLRLFLTLLQTPRNLQCQTSSNLYDCSRVKCTGFRLSVSSSLRLPGIPCANRAKTSLSSLFKASRELLQFTHWYATVFDTVIDFQDLQCQTLKNNFAPSHKHLNSTAPDAIAYFKESLVLNKFRPVSTSTDPSAQCTSLRLPLAPWQTSRNLWCQTCYLVITS